MRRPSLAPAALACLLLALVIVPDRLRAELAVVDDAGRMVRLARPAHRIVSLAPHATELLFAAGAGAYVVAVSEHSDYPPPARALPRVGGGGSLDLERILALRPDLVVAWQSGNGQVPEQLQRLGLAVFLSEPRRIDDIATSLERLGRLAGSDIVAARAARHFREQVETLRSRYAGRRRLRVFYQVWDRPLMTVNGRHMISAWLRLCGAENIFSDLPELAPTVSLEAVVAADPDAIVAGAGKSGNPLVEWKRWPGLGAVRLGHLLTVPADELERQTPRAVEGARVLCEKLDAVRRDAGSGARPRPVDHLSAVSPEQVVARPRDGVNRQQARRSATARRAGPLRGSVPAPPRTAGRTGG